MSFSFAGAGGGSAFGSPITPQNPGAQIESGPDLEEILTEVLTSPYDNFLPKNLRPDMQ